MKQGDSPYDIDINVRTATEKQSEILSREARKTAPRKNLMETFTHLLQTIDHKLKTDASIYIDHHMRKLES